MKIRGLKIEMKNTTWEDIKPEGDAETQEMQIQQNVDEQYKVQLRVTFLPAWLLGQQQFVGISSVGSLVILKAP